MAVLLITIDEPIARELVAAFRAAGVDVLGPCRNCFQAKALVAERTPDAAVVDTAIPGAPFDVVRSLRAEGVRVVLIATCTQSPQPPEFSLIPLWCKPFDAREVARLLYPRRR